MDTWEVYFSCFLFLLIYEGLRSPLRALGYARGPGYDVVGYAAIQLSVMLGYTLLFVHFWSYFKPKL